MKYFMDTEFIERGPDFPIELISLGIVAEDGREFYRISNDFRPAHANDWVRQNVLAGLPENTYDVPWRSNVQIAVDVMDFIGDDLSPQFWGYFAAYDWVVFCQLFGDMSGLPSHFPYYCHDLRQALDGFHFHHIKQDDSTHNALDDARWMFSVYQRVGGIYG